MKTIILLASILLLAFFLAGCQPAGDEAGNGSPTVGGNTEVTLPAGEPVEAVTCTNIDEETLVQEGNDVYSTRCASCHGGAGEGSGTFPGLADVDSLNSADAVATLQTFFNPEIHPFVNEITNMDAAAVLSYTRGAFGNDAPVICPEAVDAFRSGP